MGKRSQTKENSEPLEVENGKEKELGGIKLKKKTSLQGTKEGTMNSWESRKPYVCT